MTALNSAQASASQWRPAPALRSSSPAALQRPALRLAVPVRRNREPSGGVPYEIAWLQRPDQPADGDPSQILVRRWKEEGAGVRHHSKEADPDFATVAIALRPTEATLSASGQCLHDGRVPAGFAFMTPAGFASSVDFRGPCDILHLFVPVDRLRQIAGGPGGEEPPMPAEPAALSSADPIIERLAWLLLKAGDHEACCAKLYIDGIAVAIVARLLESSRPGAGPAGSGQGLVKWRLKRVQEFIEAQLSEPLSLADLARCAGLSRMHFAAQFRAATGMRPHEYVVRRRIQRAQEMLLTTTEPLVQVALNVGFQTQAHFTTVFRRLLGETPGRWRQVQRFG